MCLFDSNKNWFDDFIKLIYNCRLYMTALIFRKKNIKTFCCTSAFVLPMTSLSEFLFPSNTSEQMSLEEKRFGK